MSECETAGVNSPQAEIERLQQELAEAQVLLRAAVQGGEWWDGKFCIELNKVWLNRARAAGGGE